MVRFFLLFCVNSIFYFAVNFKVCSMYITLKKKNNQTVLQFSVAYSSAVMSTFDEGSDLWQE